MSDKRYYRGGLKLMPKRGELKFDKATGFVKAERGVSVYDRPDGLEKFGGASEVTDLPEGLKVVQIGNDPHHHEVIPAIAMPEDRYIELLNQTRLVPAADENGGVP